MKEYYTTEEVASGVDGIPKIRKTTLRNLRQTRKIRYTKIGNECMYKREWIQEYINKNEVQPIAV